MASRKPSRVAPLLSHPLTILIILTALAHSPCLFGDFVWDDIQYVIHNNDLQDIQGLTRIWFQPSSSPQYYPLTFTTYWLEYQFMGLEPAGYHLVNLCLHLANTVLVYLLLRRLGLARVAWLAGFLFGIHPLRVEPVAWIAARKDVLSCLFALCSLHVWVRTYNRISPLGLLTSLGLFLAALLSKNAICPLPAVMVLIVWWKEGMVSKRVWTASLPFFLLAVLSVGVFNLLEKASIDSARLMVQFSLSERIQIAGHAFWFYIGKTLCPYPLMTIYPRWKLDPTSFTEWLFPITAILTLGILFARSQRWGKGPFVCLAVYTVLIAPYLGLVSWAFSRFSFTADRYVYLAGMGLLLPICHGAVSLEEYLRRVRPDRPVIAWALAAALIFLTFSQSLLFHDSEILFRHNLRLNPDSWGVHTALGAVVLSEPGRVKEAAELFQEAVRLEPESSQAHYNLGVALEAAVKPDEALHEYERALEIEPEYAEAHNNLAILLTNRGSLQEALRHITEAIRIKPGVRDFQENKNMLLLKINQPAPVPAQPEGPTPVIEERTEAPSPEPAVAPGMVPEYDHPSGPESPR